MTIRCRFCALPFSTDEEYLGVLGRLSLKIKDQLFEIPAPTLCPDCRQQRRLVRRNERHLYRRTCDKCSCSMISSYSTDKHFTVYCHECWWGDSWDRQSYGREYDFTRGFFDQFGELQRSVPRLTLMNRNPENSEYCNYAGDNKNCFLAVGGSWYNENCLYGTRFLRSRSSIDCSFTYQCELCYEVVWGNGLYDCFFVIDSFNCSNCYFSRNLRGCTNCFFSSNLRNKSYQIKNLPATKEECEALRAKLASFSALEQMKQEFETEMARAVRPATLNINCEGSSGDYLTNCKNARHSFMSIDVEDGRYLILGDEGKNLYDCSCTGYNQAELFYETISAGIGGKLNLFSSGNWSCSSIAYCDTIMSCMDCFGCVGLKFQKYCILNKQYSREDYEKLIPRIIESMRKTKEWGEFFPPALSPWAFNETLAAELFPLTREEAEKRGYYWEDEEPTAPLQKKISPPDRIADLDESILREVLSCTNCEKPYKIVPQEFSFYQANKIALPRRCPHCRHERRVRLRNPAKLWPRECSRCGKELLSSYAPSRPETIACEDCYLKETHGDASENMLHN